VNAGQAFAVATAPLRATPDFVVLGVKRAGTTTLYRYLVQHPQVRPLRMFKGTHYFDVRHDKPWWWYRSCFPVRRRGTLTGEASPYYLFHPLAPERIADALPAARFIVVLREPVDRAYSQWLFEVRSGHEDLDFRSAVMREPERVAGEVERMRADRGYESAELRHHAYLARSRYAEQLRRLYSLVSPERVLVLQTERMSADPGAEMARVGLPRAAAVGTVTAPARRGPAVRTAVRRAAGRGDAAAGGRRAAAHDVAGGRRVVAAMAVADDREVTGGRDEVARMARGSALSLVLSVAAQGCTVGVTVLLARLTGAADVGRYAQAQAVLALLQLFALGGLRAGLTRFVAMQRAERDASAVHGTVRAGVALSGCAACALGALLFVLAPQIAVGAFHDPGFVTPLCVVAGILPLATLSDAALAATQGFRRMRAYAVVQLLIEPVLRIALTAAALLAGGGTSGALVALLLSNAVATLLAFRSLSRLLGPAPRRVTYALRPLLSFSAVSWTASMATTGLIWADTVMLGILTRDTDVGVYNVATRLVTLAAFVMVPVNQAVGPRLAHLSHVDDRDELRRVYAVATGWIVRLSLPAFIVLIVFPRDLLALFGHAFVAGAAVTVVLAAGKFVDAATGPCAVLLNMSGRPRYNMLANLAALVLNVVLNLVLIPPFGIVGAATAWAVSLVLVNAVRVWYVRRILGTLPFDTGTRRGLVAAAGALAVVLAPAHDVLRLAAGVAVYVGLVLALGLTADDRATLTGVLRTRPDASRRLPGLRSARRRVRRTDQSLSGRRPASRGTHEVHRVTTAGPRSRPGSDRR
jgi:O-antigen/teichoic acid export membrane protein